jgi:hypothetical protein
MRRQEEGMKRVRPRTVLHVKLHTGKPGAGPPRYEQLLRCGAPSESNQAPPR